MRKGKPPIVPAPFRVIPRDIQKEQGPNHQLFHEARKGAPTHWAGTPSPLFSAPGRFCKQDLEKFAVQVLAGPAAALPPQSEGDMPDGKANNQPGGEKCLASAS